jgi:hypothetical protein
MNERGSSADQPADDWLDVALRADAREHHADYLAEDGFTARVMAALPAPATLPAWRKRAVIGMWTAASVGIAVALPGAYMDVAREFVRVAWAIRCRSPRSRPASSCSASAAGPHVLALRRG